MGRYWLGIDIGGTFTDFTLFDTATRAAKTPRGEQCSGEIREDRA